MGNKESKNRKSQGTPNDEIIPYSNDNLENQERTININAITPLQISNQELHNTHQNKTLENSASENSLNFQNPENKSKQIFNQRNIFNENEINNINKMEASTISNNINNNNQNPLMPYLNKAYQLFTEGNNLTQHFSFHEGLLKYEEAFNIITNIYTKINDEMLKCKVDYFFKSLNSQIDFVNFQIKNQFSFKEKAGFASRDNNNTKKVDYLESFRKGSFDINENNYTIRSKSKEIIRTNSKLNENGTRSFINKSNENQHTKNNTQSNTSSEQSSSSKKSEKDSSVVSNDLKERILSEIVDNKPGIKFSDVIGLEQAKQILKEIIILPNLRPDLFTGLRSPPRGLLLFGPPGVGKTMIAKAVATECQCTFFNISASSLTSKYLGESEKLVRALFDFAYEKQPSVVFIDEIESILSKRSDGENDATKRLKTEFLVQFDGVGSNQDAKILIIGATNRPQELDSAVLRRLPKRIYIGPFELSERKAFIQTIMKSNDNSIKDNEYTEIAKLTSFYSNSDLKELCREAAYEPIREITDLSEINKVKKLRPTVYEDFLKATKKVRGTLNPGMLSELENWNESYGAIN